MVEAIKSNKDALLKRLEQVINEKGPERMNVQEAGMLTDQIKDLAEAEKSCWEAEYYRNISEGMEGQGQGGMGYNMGYGQNGPQGGMSGSSDGRYGYRDSMGRYARRGYHTYGYHDGLESVREAMASASPEEKEKMKRELRQMADM